MSKEVERLNRKTLNKKALTLIAGGLLLTSMTSMAFANVRANINISLDNKTITQTAETGFAYVADGGRTMVPLRLVSENMGYDVKWDKATQTATIIENDTTVKIKIGSKTPTVNGKVKTIDAPATIKEGRTYVPVRFISEAMGEQVSYSNKTVYIGSVQQGLGLPEVPKIGKTATYNYEVDSKVLMDYFGEYQTPYALHPAFENDMKQFDVLKYYEGYNKEFFDVRIEIRRWADDLTTQQLIDEGLTTKEVQMESVQKPKAYFKEVLKFYLPKGAEKLYTIIDDGLNNRLKDEEKYINKDIQNIIGSDGKQVKLVLNEEGFYVQIKR